MTNRAKLIVSAFLAGLIVGEGYLWLLPAEANTPPIVTRDTYRCWPFADVPDHDCSIREI